MLLSEIKSYVVVLCFYIKKIKRRTLQVSSSKHNIKKDMTFSLGKIEIILVGQGGSPALSPFLAMHLWKFNPTLTLAYRRKYKSFLVKEKIY